MTKVLHVVGKMNIGGAEVLLMNLYRNIDRTRIQFDFLCYDDGNSNYFENEIIKLGGKVITIPPINHFAWKRNVRNIEKIIKMNQYDVIHTHIGSNAAFAVKAAKNCGVPIRIVHAHSVTIPKRSLIKRINDSLLSLITNKYLTACCACSRAAAKSRFNNYNLKNNYLYIPNAIDFQPFLRTGNSSYIKERLGLRTTDLIMLQVGNIKKAKNQEHTLNLLKECLNSNTNWHLILAGRETDYSYRINSLINEYKLQDHISMLGERDDIPELLSIADVFIMPSLWEGLGICALEAQAAGVPCVVSENVQPEVDIGLNLIRQCKLECLDDWVEAVCSAIEIKRPTLKERELALNNSNYSIDAVVKQIESLYEMRVEN